MAFTLPSITSYARDIAGALLAKFSDNTAAPVAATVLYGDTGVPLHVNADGSITAGVTITSQVTETKAYTAPATGAIAGAVNSAVQLPNVPCKLARLKAAAANAGKIYLGTSPATTVISSGTDTTSGFELVAGDDTGWLPVSNLNLFWHISANANDALSYWVLN